MNENKAQFKNRGEIQTGTAKHLVHFTNELTAFARVHDAESLRGEIISRLALLELELLKFNFRLFTFTIDSVLRSTITQLTNRIRGNAKNQEHPLAKQVNFYELDEEISLEEAVYFTINQIRERVREVSVMIGSFKSQESDLISTSFMGIVYQANLLIMHSTLRALESAMNDVRPNADALGVEHESKTST